LLPPGELNVESRMVRSAAALHYEV
jgi:hypothetical protein